MSPTSSNSSPQWLRGGVFAVVLLAACGGATDMGGDDPGAGAAGTPVAGAPSGGSAGKPEPKAGHSGWSTGATTQGGSTQGGAVAAGSAPVAGTPQGAAGSIGCCAAAAICNNGDRQIQSPEQCPAGAECYSNSICCSTVYCARQLVQCAAIPTCEPGDKQIASYPSGADIALMPCPPAYHCYEKSLCGTTIVCAGPLQPVCDRAKEHNRQYVATDSGTCARIDYDCPPQTKHFSNSCGCGCEQDPFCPPWVDCMPGDRLPDALCRDGSLCPFTERAH